jgi:hypothetical protein
MNKPMLISHMPSELKEEFKALNAITGVVFGKLYRLAMWHGIQAIKKDFSLLNESPYVKVKSKRNEHK